MKLDIAAPVITSHHYYELPFAVICSETGLRQWIYSEFVQWHTYRDHEDERTRISLYMERTDYENQQTHRGNDIWIILQKNWR